MDESITLREPAPAGPTTPAAAAVSGSPKVTPTVVPIGPGIGAEVRGIDLVGAVDDETLAVLRRALDEHAVIVLRGQDLTPAQQTAFAQRLGELRVSFYNRYAVPGQPELSVVSNIKNEEGVAIGIEDAGMLWHTDGSYLKSPDMYTVLYGLQIPHRADGTALGNTLFTNTSQAYETLPEATKKRIAGMKATHSFVHHLEKKRSLGNLKRAPLTEAQKNELPDVDHPIVRTHPRTGKPCLFVTEGHTSAVAGLSQDESDQLLNELWTHLKNPAFHYAHSWRKGDLIVWDNCAVHHLAVFDYGATPRRLHRAGLLGGVPV